MIRGRVGIVCVCGRGVLGREKILPLKATWKLRKTTKWWKKIKWKSFVTGGKKERRKERKERRRKLANNLSGRPPIDVKHRPSPPWTVLRAVRGRSSQQYQPGTCPEQQS